MSFKNLHLHDDILKAIEDSGYTQPTPIQEQAIPKVIEGADLLASAQTGSGKTGAFILPALHKLTTPSKVKGHGPRILILVPTRELAMQVAEQAVKYSKYLRSMKTACIYGGAPYPIQIRQLMRPLDVLVATPGRLIDHIESGRVDFSRVEFFVLDEADRMLDMGFIDPVEEIKAQLPQDVQTLLFSATLKGNVMKLAQRLLKNPVTVAIEQATGKHENIKQYMHPVDDLHHKIRLLDHLLQDKDMNQAIIFTSTKRYCDELVDELVERGHSAAALHGDLNQRKRTQRINSLKDGKTRILVATDVAARGIDVSTITHVFNFDLPRNPEDYVHRIGRTGRANAKGTAYSFASRKDRDLVRNIERFTGQKIEMTEIEGMKSKSADRPSRPFQPREDRGGERGERPARGGFGERRERSYYGNRDGAKTPFKGRDSDRASPYGGRKEYSKPSFANRGASQERSFDDQGGPRKRPAFGDRNGNVDEARRPPAKRFGGFKPRAPGGAAKRPWGNKSAAR